MPKYKTRTGKTVHKPYVFKKSRPNKKIKLLKKRNVNQKKYWQTKRSNFVETKSRDHKQIWTEMGGTGTNVIDRISNPQLRQYMVDTDDITLPSVTALFQLVWSYINPHVGVTSSDMLGRYLCPKFMNVKVSLNFPETINNIAPRLYLVHGWVTRPMDLNEFTTPTKSACTRTDLINHVLNYIKPYFDGDGQLEHTEYKEATQKDFITVGYKRIKFSQEKQLSVMPGRIVTEDSAGTIDNVQEIGDIPPQDHTLKFKLRPDKVRYDEGNTPSSSASYPFLYPNKSWIPFWLIYNKDSSQMPTGNANNFSVRYNDKTWFSDA